MRTWILALGLAWLALPAPAQVEPPATTGEAERPERQREAGRGGEFGQSRLAMYAERLAARLELDEQQRAEFQAVVAAHSEHMNGYRERAAKLRGLMSEFRAAREAGDEERAEQIREQMRELGSGERPGPMQAFLDDIEPILREDQLEKLAAFRGQAQDRGEGSAADRMEHLVARISERLNLDPEQQARFDELVAGLREKSQAQREQAEDMRGLTQELREAYRAGDADRITGLSEQLRERRQSRQQLLEEFFTQLEGTLRDDQKEILQRYRRDQAGAGARPREAEADDTRLILRAAKRLDLSSEQADKVREIERQARDAQREVRDGGREARAALAAKVKQDIIAILKPEQVQQFEQLLANRGRPDRRPLEQRREELRERAGTPSGESKAEPTEPPKEPPTP